MIEEAVKILPFPEKEERESLESDFLTDIIKDGASPSELQRDLTRFLGEVISLRNEHRWNDIIELCYPIEEKIPHLANVDSAAILENEIVFALCQLKRFDEAIEMARKLTNKMPDVFHVHSCLAFVAYSSLLADKNREIVLTPKIRKKRFEIAHRAFARAEELRPDGVTVFYRHGMLFKAIQQRVDRALPLFKRAVDNWESLDEESRIRRHQERKNYVKALYQLSLCYLEQNYFAQAITSAEKCIGENASTQYLSNVNVYYTLGKILFEARFIERAIQSLERAVVDADPKHNDYVFELLARALVTHGQPDKALEALYRIPKPLRRPYVLWTEADVLIHMGRYDEARRVLKRAAEIDRLGQHKALIRLVKLELKVSDFDKALEYAERANQFFQTTYGKFYHEALFWEAVIFIKKGKRAEAEKALEELYHLNPFYPHLRKLRQEVARLRY